MIQLKGLFANSKWYTKTALLIGIPLFFSILSSVICVLVSSVMGIDLQTVNTGGLLGIQAFQSILTFIGGGWLYAYLISKEPLRYLGLDSMKNPWLYVIATISMFTIIPLVNITALWNDGIQLPASLQALEEFMRSLENAANDITIKMMQGEGIGSIVIALVVMALIPAIGEELLFRGGLQKGLENKTGNAHLAVWVTAFVFSFIHFQFYGFIPRLILGAALGYFYVYSKSLWIPIWAHFVNNATSVLSYKLLYQYSDETNLSTMGAPTGLEHTIMVGLALFSLATYIATMLIFVFVARDRKTQ
jgi:membrane protease YdiL (CAAX protease family)